MKVFQCFVFVSLLILVQEIQMSNSQQRSRSGVKKTTKSARKVSTTKIARKMNITKIAMGVDALANDRKVNGRKVNARKVNVPKLNASDCLDDQRKTDMFASALVPLFEKLIEGKAPKVKVNIYEARKCEDEYIFEKMMKKLGEKFTVQITFHNESSGSYIGEKPSPLCGLVTDPTLVVGICDTIFFQTFSNALVIYSINRKDRIFNMQQFYPYNRNLKFLIESKKKFIDLWSVGFFTQGDCHKSQFVRTNQFLINESRWLTNEFNTEPRRNFHGCEVTVVPIQYDKFSVYYENYDGSLETGGLYIEIIKATASTFNFSLRFLKHGATNEQGLIKSIDLNLNGSPDEIETKSVHEYLIYYNFVFLIPPGELYSDAEKLFMPLELEAWIATFVTILTALVTVQIINQLSQEVQDFVYGRNVTTPSLNIMVAFVGGAQSTLPRRNFARFLLMLFIFVSLIIRTCYQSKLFTYLQADIVKTEIQSIDELIEQNGVVFVPDNLPPDMVTYQRFEKAVKYSFKDSVKFIEKTVDPKFQGAVLTSDFLLNEIESCFKSGKTSLKVVKGAELGSFSYFPHNKDGLITEQINIAIGRLHSAGLIEFWYNRYFGHNRKKAQEESGPTPLTMDHLQAGFVVSFLSHCL